MSFDGKLCTFFSIADEFYENYAKRVSKDHTKGSYEQLLINRRQVEMTLCDGGYLPEDVLGRLVHRVLRVEPYGEFFKRTKSIKMRKFSK